MEKKNNMKKKNYTKPEIEVVVATLEDIILTSTSEVIGFDKEDEIL